MCFLAFPGSRAPAFLGSWLPSPSTLTSGSNVMSLCFWTLTLLPLAYNKHFAYVGLTQIIQDTLSIIKILNLITAVTSCRPAR